MILVLTRKLIWREDDDRDGVNQSMFDIVIIGAGIAGASVAAFIDDDMRVVLLEAETLPGYHSTGRSAAIYSAIYGNQAIRALTRASLPFLSAPPAGFADAALVNPRGTLFVAREDQGAAVARMLSQHDVEAATQLVRGAALDCLFPHFAPGHVEQAIYERDALDLDVSALHIGLLKMAKARGMRILHDARVISLDRETDGWRIATATHQFKASIVVNAAGAWAGEVAALAGACDCGIQPMKRTVALADLEAGPVAHDGPMVVDIGETFYFKPESGGILLSPADETCVPASDVHADDLDIAVAVDRIMAATILNVRRIRSAWAGLRSFAPDRSPVVGYDPLRNGFFWLGGQGGFGIQTAPALGRLASALLTGKEAPRDILDQGLEIGALLPDRFNAPKAAAAASSP